jgi:hypothetical protein
MWSVVHDPGRNFLSRNFFGRVYGERLLENPQEESNFCPGGVSMQVHCKKNCTTGGSSRNDLMGDTIASSLICGRLVVNYIIYSMLSIFWEERFGGKQMYWNINIIPGVAFHNCVLFLASVGDIAQFSRAISEIPRPLGTVSWCFFSRICFAAVGLENGWAQLVEWATEGGHPIMPQILQKIGTTGLYLQWRPWHLKGEQSATWNELWSTEGCSPSPDVYQSWTPRCRVEFPMVFLDLFPFSQETPHDHRLQHIVFGDLL